jgi:hypothetical protein
MQWHFEGVVKGEAVKGETAAVVAFYPRSIYECFHQFLKKHEFTVVSTYVGTRKKFEQTIKFQVLAP